MFRTALRTLRSHRLRFTMPALAVVPGVAGLVLLMRSLWGWARAAAALAVALIVWAWGVAQYPLMLVPDLAVARAAAPPSVPAAVLIVCAVGALLLIPSLGWLYALFQRPRPARRRAPRTHAER